MLSDSDLLIILDYHEKTKHFPNRFARSLGYLDWANQPDPFLRFEGSPMTLLDQPTEADSAGYESVMSGSFPEPRPLNHDLVSHLFFDSLSISAWKEAAQTRWSLRVNPSSGNLHPTEAYLLCPQSANLDPSAALFHYRPDVHGLELRRRLKEKTWKALTRSMTEPCLLIGLSSIYWRESWKYGERAFRYCQHDLGHAVAALSVAAGGLGWSATLLDPIPHSHLAVLLGLDHSEGPEAEVPECLLLLQPRTTDQNQLAELSMDQHLIRQMAETPLSGERNQLSRASLDWPTIERVEEASRPSRRGSVTFPKRGTVAGESLKERHAITVRQLVRQRRSAVAMDGVTWLNKDEFFQVLSRTLVRHCWVAGLSVPWEPNIDLICWVHRVRSLEAGVYFFARCDDSVEQLRTDFDAGFEWSQDPDWPSGFSFYRLKIGDFRGVARHFSCDQAIAADGVATFAMLARFAPPLRDLGPWFYRRLHWETGIIGQILYLEAEAAGIRGTGIGCFFDDPTHRFLGLQSNDRQVLYHFTIGGAFEDSRVRSLPAYWHLASQPRSIHKKRL